MHNVYSRIFSYKQHLLRVCKDIKDAERIELYENIKPSHIAKRHTNEGCVLI